MAERRWTPKPLPPLGPGEVRRLAGGNPQIAKGDGAGPVREWVAACPGWTREVGERLDALMAREVPGVARAVRWNSPLWGVEGQGWFASAHVFKRFVKVTFFKGVMLVPPPPGGTPKSGEARWVDLREGEAPDDARMAEWVRQAAALPGWMA